MIKTPIHIAPERAEAILDLAERFEVGQLTERIIRAALTQFGKASGGLPAFVSWLKTAPELTVNDLSDEERLGYAAMAAERSAGFAETVYLRDRERRPEYPRIRAKWNTVGAAVKAMIEHDISRELGS